jgi:membrane protease YdiL (CAAX protease family)
MHRVADLGKNKRLAWIVRLVAVNMMFGFAHSYQRITGIIDEGLMGVLLGLFYLGTGCNLSVPIIVHGIADTVDLLLIFLGKYPGMGR